MAKEYLKQEQISVTKTLKIFHEGMSNKALNPCLSRLSYLYGQAGLIWEDKERAAGTSSEVQTTALMKSIEGIMYGAGQIYSPQAQARLYETVIEALSQQVAQIKKDIDNEDLLSQAVSLLCLNDQYQKFLNHDYGLALPSPILSAQDAVLATLQVCHANVITDFDKYSQPTRHWHELQHMFSEWLELNDEQEKRLV